MARVITSAVEGLRTKDFFLSTKESVSDERVVTSITWLKHTREKVKKAPQYKSRTKQPYESDDDESFVLVYRTRFCTT